MDDLFSIYQSLILSAREEVQRCLSRLLKDRTLSREAAAWLLGHWSESEHIVNRLLLYPQPTPPIVAWAAERYERGDLPDRRTEGAAFRVAHSAVLEGEAGGARMGRHEVSPLAV